MPAEFVSPLIGVLAFAFVMVAVLLYFCLWRNRKGGQKPDGESVNTVAKYVDHKPYCSHTLCGGVYYSYCTADIGTSHVDKNVIVSIHH